MAHRSRLSHSQCPLFTPDFNAPCLMAHYERQLSLLDYTHSVFLEVFQSVQTKTDFFVSSNLKVEVFHVDIGTAYLGVIRQGLELVSAKCHQLELNALADMNIKIRDQ